ncbi:MAG: hypothetical protein C5S45_08790 [Candidatus Methanocomedens sp.]|nr:MAG: hypothetical protein C5S45_08790 [ANME-2 cluster archaeon]
MTTDLTFITNKDGANLSDRFATLIKDPDYPEIPQKQIHLKTLEKQIDQLVYELYDLTPEEIQIVEGFNEGK